MMPKHATTAATIGCLAVLLICVFPPRDALQTHEPKARGFLFAQHFDRADVSFDRSTRTGTFTRVEVSVGRLLAELGVVVAGTGLAVCLMILRRNVQPRLTAFAEEAIAEARGRS